MTVPQHMTALKLANQIRFRRAELHERVAAAGDYQACRAELAEVVEADDGTLGSMMVSGLVRWVPKMQPRAAKALLRYVGCTEWRLLRELSPAQRRRLVEGLRCSPVGLRRATEDLEDDRRAA